MAGPRSRSNPSGSGPRPHRRAASDRRVTSRARSGGPRRRAAARAHWCRRGSRPQALLVARDRGPVRTLDAPLEHVDVGKCDQAPAPIERGGWPRRRRRRRCHAGRDWRWIGWQGDETADECTGHECRDQRDCGEERDCQGPSLVVVAGDRAAPGTDEPAGSLRRGGRRPPTRDPGMPRNREPRWRRTRQ